jgi:hypothetical protein
VTAMRAYWILPSREQNDDISASDGKTIVPLRQILDPKLRPEGFSHGVPTELLEKCGPKCLADILFAQRFPDWNGDKQLFSVSTTAGLDFSGRVVHLGVLFILEPHERPRFELPYGALSEEDRAYASALIHRMTSSGWGDSWAQSIRALSELPSDSPPATNVALDRSVVRFHSLYVLVRGALTKKSVTRTKWRMAAIILLSLFVIAGVWHYVHATNGSLPLRHSEQSSRLAVQNGVVTWRFN